MGSGNESKQTVIADVVDGVMSKYHLIYYADFTIDNAGRGPLGTAIRAN